MSVARFNPRERLIRIETTIVGPTGVASPWLALDTGATRTVISEAVARRIGFDLSRLPVTHHAHTPAGDLPAQRVRASRVIALGLDRSEFDVLIHRLNPRTQIDGLLGRDFFAGHVLTIDFARSTVGLRRPGLLARLWG